MSHTRGASAAPRSLESEPSCLTVYQKEFDYLYETLRRFELRSPDIEDVAQEVFLVLLRNWPDLDLTYSFRPYLVAIAFRLSASHRRRKAREIPFAYLEVPDEGPGPEERFESAESERLLMAALAGLPLKRRAVVLMHDLEGLPMVQVAARLSLTRFGGYARLRKARTELELALRRLMRLNVRP